jgi:hypothetical protein
MVQLRPLVLLFAGCLLMVTTGRVLRDLTVPSASLVPETAVYIPAMVKCDGTTLRCGPAPDRADRPSLGASLVAPPPIAVGSAPLYGIGGPALTNIEIALGLVDGVVIQPGQRMSFDDIARTWDFREDQRYVPGPATSARGLITMRGGGVCWLSTAIWRAALDAGLATELRENHLGALSLLAPGYDATNTLVIANDSDIPLTLRVWRDEDRVYASFHGDKPLERKAALRGPEKLGPGYYVLYQDVAWPDGSETTTEFISRYAW